MTNWFEILMPLMTNPPGTVVLIPDETSSNIERFAEIIAEKNITVLFFDLPLVKNFVDYLEEKNKNRQHEQNLQSIRTLWITNESPSVELVHRIKNLFPSIRILYLSGLEQPNNGKSIVSPLSSSVSHLPYQLDENLQIEETDQFLHHDEQEQHNELDFPGFVEKSLYCLDQRTPVRKQCLQLITCPWFEYIIISIILLNCVTLALFQPCEKQCNTVRCLWVTIADHCIFAFFAFEMCIKMIAMGVFGKGTYLADAWNRLDCFIVITG